MEVSSNNPSIPADNKKRIPAAESKAVQRAREKATNEIIEEKNAMTEKRIEGAIESIHMQQARNPHKPVSGERFTHLTGPLPSNMVNFQNKVQGNN